MNLDFKNDFSKKVYDFLKIIASCAIENNINIYFVGGIVRDKILGNKIKDIDLIIDKSAIDFSKKLPKEIKIQSIHKDFDTVKVDYLGLHFDIATTRKELYNASGVLPNVIKTGISIEKDVVRRDFSINSMYIKLGIKNQQLTYELIDLVNGIDDIKNKTLKVLHNKSYFEDPTRIIRGLGFKHRFGFDFSDDDKKLIDDYILSLNPNVLKEASRARIEAVIFKVLKNKENENIFREIVQKKYYKILNGIEYNIDYNRVNEIALKLNKIQKANFYMKVLNNEPISKIENKNKLDILKNFSKFKLEELAYYFYKTNDKNVEIYNEIKDFKLNIKGEDLLKLNIKQGKLFKEIFDSLLLYKIENNIKDYKKEDEIAWVKKAFAEHIH